MRITITIKGEPDVLPYTKRFQFQKPDDEVFIASCEKIKNMLDAQQKININDTLLLLSALIVSSIIDGKDRSIIRKEISSSLSAEQVMIGVPEMLHMLDFEVILGDRRFMIAISRPIPIRNSAGQV